ncbi:ATPase family protein associated with various cellular activities (AAA) [Belliella baltica DSM 15883]|uniref:ATPase family protein associated with various cellular activities (AAA) n=1 Tax=Belliella baltica (strain DSM 15883 / CIP 108006 / LMG 21964 / BA134) TaxID=866536 RepID=I3Z3C1_BELBD|nr:AAA family ATPase [Belliella baltica]AFL83739.1 ATPase family protein associated with various cellular activities (AAA) [Belliella baltica DSM 15883]
MEDLTFISTKLSRIKKELKSEFIGLDEIIDQLIQAVNPWCTMSASQSRPLVINLWGMTGVGKTSLVKRFLELWDREESPVYFNMGSKNYVREMLNSMENMFAHSGKPTVFIFDEFQHAKTMNATSGEIENPVDRMIWQLMDNGKFNYAVSWHDFNELSNISAGLELCLQRGVKVKKGKVVEGWTTFQNITAVDDPRYLLSGDEKDDQDFISKSEIRALYDHYRFQYPFISLFRDYIYQLDGEELVAFVKKIEKRASMSTELDFSKAIIFVIGNLDEAYRMSDIVSSDCDPDLLYEESKKITFSTIKEALKERFRLEEIGRLGNIHLIYPSLNSQVYRDFIQSELKELSQRFALTFGCELHFSKSVETLLFEEGVTPTQGFRPLRSSIRYILESSLVELLQNIPNESRDKIFVDSKGDELNLYRNDNFIANKLLHLPVREAKRRKLNPQDMAVTAVHEAGHALVYSVLCRKFPKMVTIASSDFNTGGYMEGETFANYENYDQLIRSVAIKLAGKKAEEHVFGRERITRGCQTDLLRATRQLVFVSREGSLTGIDRAYESKFHGDGTLLEEKLINQEWVEDQLEKASQLADMLIIDNQSVLKNMIAILLERKFVRSDSLQEALELAGVDTSVFLESYPKLFDYHSKLSDFLTS